MSGSISNKSIIGCLTLLMLTSARVSGTSLSFADNQVFPHGYIDYDASGPLIMTDYPFVSAGHKFVFQTSHRSLYDMKELTDNRAGLSLSGRSITVALNAATFGQPDYFHQWGLSAIFSYHHKEYSIGSSVIYNRLSFGGGYSYLSSLTVNTGMRVRYRGLGLFSVIRSINQPRFYPGSPAIRPEIETGLSYRSGSGLDSQVKALFVRHRKPTAELSQSFAISRIAGLNWSLVLRPARFGGGFYVAKGWFTFDYRISHHPVLGFTHGVTLIAHGPEN